MNLSQSRIEGGLRATSPLHIKRSRANKPLVSVITVTFNAEGTLQRSIDSVRDQTYDNIEHIVIDGRSTDSTLEIIRDNSNGIDYFLSERDKGIYDAMNKGISISSGDYVIMLNADDWYEAGAIERLVHETGQENADFVGALARYINHDGSNHILPSMELNEATQLRMPLRHQTMLLPRWIYQRLGNYNLSYPIIADHEFTIRLYKHGIRYKEVPEALLNFSTTGVSNTNWEALHNEHIRLLLDVFPSLSQSDAERIGNHSTARPADFLEACRVNKKDDNLILACQLLLDEFAHLWGGHWQAERIDIRKELSTPMLPSISIVIPMHNSEDTIANAISSCQAQRGIELEIICIDDCSTDKTKDVVCNLQTIDNRISLIRNEINQGPGASRNKGIDYANGAYIFFLDADDVIHPNGLKPLLLACEKTSACMARGSFKISRMIFGNQVDCIKCIHMSTDTEDIEVLSDGDKYRALESTEGHWACLYKADFVRHHRYPEGLRIGEDSVFIITAITNAKAVAIISDIVYEYRDSENSTMKNYTLPKLIDELEWRSKAWDILAPANIERASYFALDYWSPWIAENIKTFLTTSELHSFEKSIQSYLNRLPPQYRDESSELNRIVEIAQSSEEKISQVNPQHSLSASEPHQHQPLRILIINSLINGGAAVAAWRMLDALREAGHDAYAVSMASNPERGIHQCYFDTNAFPGLIHQDQETVWNCWENSVAVQEATSRELFSKDCAIADSEKLANAVNAVDIVILHWHTGLLDPGEISKILNGKPLIWVLHDMNPLTGGCHYSEGCSSFSNKCDKCPLLPPGKQALALNSLDKKLCEISKIENIDIVCPSNWLADKARESVIFRNKRIHVIPNFADQRNFLFRDKIASRIKLGLSPNKNIVLFGADSLSNPRKGGHFLSEALGNLCCTNTIRDLQIVTFGGSELDLPVPTINLGKINEPSILGGIFSAADVFVFPSLEENAPQVVIEAQLSGCPVVAFPVGNVDEIIVNEECGYIARHGDAKDLAEGIATVLLKNKAMTRREAWSMHYRISSRAKRLADHTLILHSYLELLRQSLSR